MTTAKANNKLFGLWPLLLFATAVVVVIIGYTPMWHEHAPTAFGAVEEDLSYGWLVPIFSLYVLWRERRELASSISTPANLGLALLIPSLFVGYLGVRGSQLRFEIVGFVGVMLGLTAAFFGKQTMKRAAFPLCFLLFCMPLHSFLDIITIHLRVFAVSAAYETLRGLGVEIIRTGTMLMSPTGAFSIDVAEPCSGLRSLFAMMALTAGYAYFVQPTWKRRALLFGLSLPIAVLGNIVRIFTIVAVAASCSAEFATGFYHDYSGYVVFLVAIAAMVATSSLITKGAEHA